VEVAEIEWGSKLSGDLTLEQQVCFSLAVASRGVISLYRPILEPMGLTHAQYLVMVALWQAEPLSGKELSALLKLDPPAVSPLLKRLETAGLIERHRDPNDERSLRVTLTGKGRELRTQALEIPGLIVDRLGLSIRELEGLHDMLLQVIECCAQWTEQDRSAKTQSDGLVR
jgi:MarR family transcriptional regulator, organic hydroperoxide resistance regulator